MNWFFEKQVGIYLSHPDAKMPTRAYKGDVGYDLYALNDVVVPLKSFVEVDTGVHLQLPRNMYAQINTRSSFGKRGLFVHHGVIDSGFIGKLTLWIYNVGSNSSYMIHKGDKIAQILFHKASRPTLKKINKLYNTERGDKGHGSSGK